MYLLINLFFLYNEEKRKKLHEDEKLLLGKMRLVDNDAGGGGRFDYKMVAQAAVEGAFPPAAEGAVEDGIFEALDGDRFGGGEGKEGDLLTGERGEFFCSAQDGEGAVVGDNLSFYSHVVVVG